MELSKEEIKAIKALINFSQDDLELLINNFTKSNAAALPVLSNFLQTLCSLSERIKLIESESEKNVLEEAKETEKPTENSNIL